MGNLGVAGMVVAYPLREAPSPERHCNQVKIGIQSAATVMGSTSNILTIRPPRLPESRPRSGQDSETLSGSLSVVSALDLIEWLCSSRKIWSLRLHSDGPGHTIAGEVVVVDGQMVDARWGEVHGLPALCEIVGCQKGTFDLAPVSGSVERTLEGNWQSLLLSAVQMLDERNYRSREDTPSEAPQCSPRSSSPSGRSGELLLMAMPPDSQGQAAAPSTPSVAASVFDARKDANTSAVALIDKGFAALRAGNPAEARQSWTQALVLDPDNRSLQFNLRKLDSSS
jgi:hypothetical protein